MSRAFLAIALVAVIVAGCTQPPASTPTTAPPTTKTTAASHAVTGEKDSENFDSVSEGQLPAGWTKFDGTWGVDVDSQDAAHPKVMHGEGADPPGLSSLVDEDAGVFDSVEASVQFKMIEGDAGAGLVFNWQDEDDYLIVRYSIRENSWHLFTMIDGNRLKKDEATVAGDSTHPDVGQWVTLRVRSAGAHVDAFDNTTKVIDYTLPYDAPMSGHVGLFLRADQTADFDDFEVEPV